MSDTDPLWRPAYIGIGSNLGNPVRQIETAIERVADIADTRLVAQSPLYCSAPFGGVEQPDFVNGVLAILTRLAPTELLARLQQIERAAGREKGGVRWGPRELDLDLLVYSSVSFKSDDLVIPHPGIGERNFVLLPLRDLAPDLIIPGLGRVSGIPVNGKEPAISRID